MRITSIETLWLNEFSNVLWVLIHTDEGITGLGETFSGSKAVEAFIHETAALKLIGQDPMRIEHLNRELLTYVGFSGQGAEERGRSAIDIALWDLFGKVVNQPVYQLLGGLCRDKVRTYNTCAGYKYVRNRPTWGTDDWGLEQKSEGPYEDLDAFLNNADELAHSLLEQGITGMKIWPFDTAAVKNNGYDISSADLNAALVPFEKIRKAVGDKMDIHVELHSLWRLPGILKVVKALEPFDPYWIEDPIRMDGFDDLRTLSERTSAPICASETLGTIRDFRSLMEAQCAHIVMPDVGWCGGITETKKIAAIAEAYQRPVAPHDCQGPVVLAASVHMSLALPNVLVQESVRAFYDGWYGELVDTVPRPTNGFFLPPEGPGLGLNLLPELWTRDDANRKVTDA
ncbi:mandelate racemase/muconate lactonizing enzyme family protein [Hwanghaeella grinnelliae]|uniref:Mandelate racemase/muconate lactonizing enzyme family protein n=1 Tax=Hwanghaeella grinnelliae TaxID=2500179 RepID=A0A437QMZ2_9PROT|nr:mandelate racemase/muconate lactonizing enzyme family protein [Hwanghaeella grinnelliae]RVU35914.1 mandelate racemase/muconate lactonizing enzyme family protein [Hwanghaeella grinnelliae]